MKHSSSRTIFSLCITTAMLSTAAIAQDWPQWRGANRDAKVTGFEAPKTWPKELAQKWKIEVGSGDSTPALVGDKLYVFSRQGDEEVLRCLEAGSGKEIWQAKYAADAVKGPDSGHGGPRSCPVVTGGKVITLGVTGILSCFDASTGKMLWQKTDYQGAYPRFHTAMSPLVVDNLCIAQLGKESDGAIVAYDLGSGEQKWKWAQEGPGYASPVVLTLGDTKMVVTETAKSIVGLSVADGKLLWQAPYAPQGMAYNAATPIVDGQTLIFCGQGRGARAVKIEKQGDTFAAKELWNNTENSVQFNTGAEKRTAVRPVSAREFLLH